MEKKIYENESGKLIANVDGGVINLTQYIEGEIIGAVSMFTSEARELIKFIDDNGLDDLED